MNDCLCVGDVFAYMTLTGTEHVKAHVKRKYLPEEVGNFGNFLVMFWESGSTRDCNAGIQLKKYPP